MNELTPFNLVGEWATPDRLLMLYYIFNSAVQAMPDPDNNSSAVYVFVFKFIHLIAGNINMTRKSFPKK